MHGAKGLQWDVVILPGLGHGQAQGDRGMRLAGAGRAVEQDALRDLPPEPPVPVRLLEEVHHFLQLGPRLVDARDVGEAHLLRALRQELGPAFAERHRLVAAHLHLPHDEYPEEYHQYYGGPEEQELRVPRVRFHLLRRYPHALGLEHRD